MEHSAPANDTRNVTSLAAAIRSARVEGVERSQVVAELRGAEIARLDMLKDAISPVLAQVPQAIDLFDAGIVPGEHPRLFIDMIGFVEMARDRRTYSFVQDTRHGRVVMAQSDRLDVMEQAVTNYIARRIVERERALASDMTLPNAAPDAGRPAATAPVEPAAGAPAKSRPKVARKRRFFYASVRFMVEFLGVFAMGMLLIAGILAAVYFGYPTARIWMAGLLGWQPF